MKDSKSTALRLVFALGLFDLLQMALHRGVDPFHSEWRLWTVVYLVPFGFYWLLSWPIRQFAKGKWLIRLCAALLVVRLIKFVIAHVWWGFFLTASPRYAIGIAACLLVIFFPRGLFDRFISVFLHLVPVSAVIFLAMFLMAPEQASFGLGPQGVAKPGSPNLVLLSWDTVRADVLPMYGGTLLPMPRLQQFADTSIQFEDCVAHAPITGPSHASMLTGVTPPSHGLRSNVWEVMPSRVLRLPEILRNHGYHTGGFIAAYPLRNRFGFGRGFEVYDDRMNESVTQRLKDLGYFDSIWVLAFAPFIGKGTTASTPGDIVQERAFDWLDSLPEEDPYFLFLHLYDAHGPWTPQGKYKQIADAGRDRALPKAIDPIDADAMARYRGDVAMMDDYLDTLLVELNKHDPGLKNTVILLTADHGECFGEGGIHKNHVDSLFEATQHVPMFLHLPANEGAGVHVTQTVAHIDILPTMLAAASIELPPALQGADSYPLQKTVLPGGLGYEQRSVYMEAQHFNLKKNRQIGWRTSEWKFIDRRTGVRNLWHYRENETEDFITKKPDLATQMLSELRKYYKALPKVEGVRVEQSYSDQAAMSGLGYAGSDADSEE